MESEIDTGSAAPPYGTGGGRKKKKRKKERIGILVKVIEKLPSQKSTGDVIIDVVRSMNIETHRRRMLMPLVILINDTKGNAPFIDINTFVILLAES